MTSQRHMTAATRAGCIRGAAVVLSLGSLLAAAPLAACGGAQPAAQADETRSLAEYDLARDAFQHGRPREALAHVEKALALDEDNAEAAYLGALLLLGFCAGDAHSSD